MTSCYCCCCCSCCCCQLRIHRSPICFKHPLCSFKRSNGMKFSSQCDSNCDKCFESVWSEFQWIVVPTGGDDSTLSLSLSLLLMDENCTQYISPLPFNASYHSIMTWAMTFDRVTFPGKAQAGSVTWWLDHFFDIWPFTEVKLCPGMIKNCQRRFQILPNTKSTLKNLPKWRKFAKSGHTAGAQTVTSDFNA